MLESSLPAIISPAILYLEGSYLEGSYETTSGPWGAQVASRDFLQGLIRHGRLETLHGYMGDRHAKATAFERLARDLGATIPVRTIQPHRLNQVAELGVLFFSGPNLAKAATQRSFVGSRAYALTGVTHTTAGYWPMKSLANLASAPVHPWDALVCTSRAVATMVDQILRAEEARLAERLGATRFPRPLLPLIPLGVDAAHFTPREEWRAAWRERLGIGAEEVAALYVGRLTRHGKAHPLPMLAALGRAARSQKQSLHLILAGWWMHSPEEAIWREQATVLCPEVQLHVLDGRDEKVRREIWSAADLFAALVDNIQETFGLAPVEAMAAGLPVVATDWDGFRDTVRHGVDGILVPTLMAPPGEGLEAALCHATEHISYGAFLSVTARLTAVDINAAGEAFRALAADPTLRLRMGAAGQARVWEAFDWAAVIPQYQDLWREQQAIRLAAPVPEIFPVPNPCYMDPNQAFAAWPSGTFCLSQRLRPEPVPATADLRALLRFTAPALPGELDEAGIAQLLAELHRRGETTARELLEVLEPAQRHAGQRAVLWLLRVGLAVTV
jgi:glycosyltransferase involved in cell wall biosynthesis